MSKKARLIISVLMVVCLLCFSGCSAISAVKDRFFGGQADNSKTELPGSTLTVETAETVAPFLEEDEVELPEESAAAEDGKKSDKKKDSDKETEEAGAEDETEALSEDTGAESGADGETEAAETVQADTESAASEAEADTEGSAEVTYEDVNETVYTTESTYARNGPGPDGEVAKVINAGTQIRRIGKGSDGYDKVDINGELYYMSSDSLSTSAP